MSFYQNQRFLGKASGDHQGQAQIACLHALKTEMRSSVRTNHHILSFVNHNPNFTIVNRLSFSTVLGRFLHVDAEVPTEISSECKIVLSHVCEHIEKYKNHLSRHELFSTNFHPSVRFFNEHKLRLEHIVSEHFQSKLLNFVEVMEKLKMYFESQEDYQMFGSKYITMKNLYPYLTDQSTRFGMINLAKFMIPNSQLLHVETLSHPQLHQRAGHCVCFSRKSMTFFIYGGYWSGKLTNDLFEYFPETDLLKRINPKGKIQLPRAAFSSIHCVDVTGAEHYVWKDSLRPQVSEDEKNITDLVIFGGIGNKRSLGVVVSLVMNKKKTKRSISRIIRIGANKTWFGHRGVFIPFTKGGSEERGAMMEDLTTVKSTDNEKTVVSLILYMGGWNQREKMHSCYSVFLIQELSFHPNREEMKKFEDQCVKNGKDPKTMLHQFYYGKYRTKYTWGLRNVTDVVFKNDLLSGVGMGNVHPNAPPISWGMGLIPVVDKSMNVLLLIFGGVSEPRGDNTGRDTMKDIFIYNVTKRTWKQRLMIRQPYLSKTPFTRVAGYQNCGLVTERLIQRNYDVVSCMTSMIFDSFRSIQESVLVFHDHVYDLSFSVDTQPSTTVKKFRKKKKKKKKKNRRKKKKNRNLVSQNIGEDLNAMLGHSELSTDEIDVRMMEIGIDKKRDIFCFGGGKLLPQFRFSEQSFSETFNDLSIGSTSTSSSSSKNVEEEDGDKKEEKEPERKTLSTFAERMRKLRYYISEGKSIFEDTMSSLETPVQEDDENFEEEQQEDEEQEGEEEEEEDRKDEYYIKFEDRRKRKQKQQQQQKNIHHNKQKEEEGEEVKGGIVVFEKATFYMKDVMENFHRSMIKWYMSGMKGDESNYEHVGYQLKNHEIIFLFRFESTNKRPIFTFISDFVMRQYPKLEQFVELNGRIRKDKKYAYKKSQIVVDCAADQFLKDIRARNLRMFFRYLTTGCLVFRTKKFFEIDLYQIASLALKFEVESLLKICRCKLRIGDILERHTRYIRAVKRFTKPKRLIHYESWKNQISFNNLRGKVQIVIKVPSAGVAEEEEGEEEEYMIPSTPVSSFIHDNNFSDSEDEEEDEEDEDDQDDFFQQQLNAEKKKKRRRRNKLSVEEEENIRKEFDGIVFPEDSLEDLFVIHAHKALLRMRSPFFEGMFPQEDDDVMFTDDRNEDEKVLILREEEEEDGSLLMMNNEESGSSDDDDDEEEEDRFSFLKEVHEEEDDDMDGGQGFIERKTNRVRIDEDEISLKGLSTMIEYFYTNRLDNLTAQMCVSLYLVAKKFQIKQISAYLRRVMKPSIDDESVLPMIYIGDVCNDQEVRTFSMHYFAKNFEKILHYKQPQRRIEFFNLSHKVKSEISEVMVKHYKDSCTRYFQLREEIDEEVMKKMKEEEEESDDSEDEENVF